MPELLPPFAALVLFAIAERGWRKRPLRRQTDAAACRIMWTITAAGLGLDVVIWVLAILIEPSLSPEQGLIRGLAWLVATVAAGRFAMRPVARRIADSGMASGMMPAVVLWGASVSVWCGVFGLVGAVIKLTTGNLTIPVLELLLLFGGLGVLERSNGWRICLLVLWGLTGLVGFVLLSSAWVSLAVWGHGPVVRVGSFEVMDSRGLAVVFGGGIALFGFTLATIMAGPSGRGWCVGRPRSGDTCTSCGFNLQGIEGNRCPECGLNSRPLPDEQG